MADTSGEMQGGRDPLVGQDILIPGSSWMPPVEGVVPGFISKRTDPSKLYPQGRYEVVVPGHRNRYMFAVEKFDRSWLQGTQDMAPKAGPKSPSKASGERPKTPSKRAKTPSKRALDADAVPSTGRTPSRGRASRTAAAAVAAATTPADAVAAPVRQARSPARDADVVTAAADVVVTAAAVRVSTRRRAGVSPGVHAPRSPSSSPARHRSLAKERPAGIAPGRTPAGSKSLLRDSNSARTPSARRVTFKDSHHVPNAHELPRITSTRNLLNLLLMVAAALPAILLGYAVVTTPAAAASSGPLAQPVTWPIQWHEVLHVSWWQRLALHSPVAWVHAVFLLNIDLGFWLLGLAQGSTWLIDPYWSILPVLIQLFYQLHPLAVCNAWRGLAAGTLLRVWAVRITHSYFRREEWQVGAREDWRFQELSRQFGKHWWWLSLFATYFSQHAMLVGITLPLYAVYSTTAPWQPLDTLAALAMLAGMTISGVADTQLRAFMVTNQQRREAGLAPLPLLNTGLWYHSRHPNYFGEQLFWWGLALYAVAVGQAWMVVGTAFNSLCMLQVTRMTEARMLARPWRRQMFEEYQRTTSMWVPWFKAQPKEEHQE